MFNFNGFEKWRDSKRFQSDSYPTFAGISGGRTVRKEIENRLRNGQSLDNLEQKFGKRRRFYVLNQELIRAKVPFRVDNSRRFNGELRLKRTVEMVINAEIEV